MRHRTLSIILVTAMALAGLALATSPAGAAGDNAAGYSSTPKKADGSLDFSKWTKLGAKLAGQQLGDLKFTRNGLDYEVRVNVADRDPSAADTAGLLVANIIINTKSGESWTYSSSDGDGSTSELWYADATTGGQPMKFSVGALTYYQMTTAKGVAVAVTGKLGMGMGVPGLAYSEVLDVTDTGQLIHNVTFTNTSGTKLPGIALSARLDTMLSGDTSNCVGQPGDCVPIVSNGQDSVYVDNGTFRLYLDKVQGDTMTAGAWNARTFYAPGTGVDVNKYTAGQTIVSKADSAVGYGLAAGDLASKKSATLAFQERLFAPAELHTVTVKYVDDDAKGATVTPVAGTRTTFTGAAGEAVGFTVADAKAGVPDKYEYASIDNVTTFGTADATITVHLVHAKTVENMTTTRTITYKTPAGVTAPADVVQTQKWTKSTDKVNGEVTYAAAAGYLAVDSPEITGYVATPKTVPATGPVASTTTVPANSTVKVTYAKVVTGKGASASTGGTAGSPATGIVVLGLLMVLAGGLITLQAKLKNRRF